MTRASLKIALVAIGLCAMFVGTVNGGDRSDVVVAGKEYTTTVESGELLYFSEQLGGSFLGAGISVAVHWRTCEGGSADDDGMVDIPTEIADKIIGMTTTDAIRLAAARYDGPESFRDGFDPDRNLSKSASQSLSRFGVCVLRYSSVQLDTRAHN